MFSALLMSSSRGGVLAFITAWIVVPAVNWRGRNARQPNRLQRVQISKIVLAALLILMVGVSSSNNILQRFSKTVLHLSGRDDLVQSTLVRIKDYPVTDTESNTFH